MQMIREVGATSEHDQPEALHNHYDQAHHYSHINKMRKYNNYAEKLYDYKKKYGL